MDESGDSPVSSASKTAESSSRSHKEAERKRRQRINDHLSTLRSLLPNTTKTDKASLLAEVVQHVRELRKKAAEVSSCEVVEERGVVKATLWCEDRPGLNGDLGRAIRSVRGKLVRAEITMVETGRSRSELVVELRGTGGGEDRVWALNRALKAVVDNKRVSCSLGPAQTKRARVSDGDGK